jgi:hypothetical protein
MVSYRSRSIVFNPAGLLNYRLHVPRCSAVISVTLIFVYNLQLMFCFVMYLPDVFNTACNFIYGNLSIEPSQKHSYNWEGEGESYALTFL